MKIAEYKKIIKKPLRPRTLVFLITDDQVLLGMKKKGLGKGNWVGIGGKAEKGETIEGAAKREVAEEIHVNVSELEKVAILNFYFPHIKDEDWNQQVHVFITKTWKGDPKESEEIQPQWFKKSELPFDSMWDDAPYWLPKVLDNYKLEAEFILDEKLKVVDYVQHSL